MFRLGFRLYQEQAQEGGEGGAPDVLDQDSLLDSGQQEQAGFYWAENVAGEGERPEWLLKKHKTVADQAKNYNELQKRFGGFTGAPDEFEIKSPEGYDGELDADDPVVKEFMDLAKESNMNQETFDKLLSLHVTNLVPQVDIQAVKQEIGSDADVRLGNMSSYLQANLSSEQYQAMQGLVNNAEAFKALETLIKLGKPTKLPVHGGENPTGVTEAEIEKLQFATDEFGERKMRDPKYAKMVRQKMTEFYGDGPDVEEVQR